MRRIKYVLGVLGCLLVLVTVVKIKGCVHSMTPQDKATDVYSTAIKYLNNKVKASVLLYGEELQFREEFQYDTIESLSKDKLMRKSEYTYLIINDLEGTASFTENDVKLLKEYADENPDFNFFYLGTKKLDLFTSGIFPNFGQQEDDQSFGYVRMEGIRLTYAGIWSGIDQQYLVKNPELLGRKVVDTIATIIKTNK